MSTTHFSRPPRLDVGQSRDDVVVAQRFPESGHPGLVVLEIGGLGNAEFRYLEQQHAEWCQVWPLSLRTLSFCGDWPSSDHAAF
ncbi:hypothetical protein [Mesorhizobium sp. M0488]|uniref:hypothetical protein n=1 Tax=unclassified Mesorhizobium TaxID=325217 RepID=UPI00333BC2B7